MVGNYVYDDSENEEKDNFYCKLHYNQKIYKKPEKKAQNGLTGIVFWGALWDLVPFKQFKNVKNNHERVLLSVKLQAD